MKEIQFTRSKVKEKKEEKYKCLTRKLANALTFGTNGMTDGLGHVKVNSAFLYFFDIHM